MNYLHTRLTKWIGPKAFGRQWEKFAALDASGLHSFIQAKVAESMPDALAEGHTCFGFGKYVTHLCAPVLGSWLAALCCSVCCVVLPCSVGSAERSDLDMVSALAETGWQVRQFPVAVDTPLCAPAVALTVRAAVTGCACAAKAGCEHSLHVLSVTRILPRLTCSTLQARLMPRRW